jgi:hypothetical protein
MTRTISADINTTHQHSSITSKVDASQKAFVEIQKKTAAAM